MPLMKLEGNEAYKDYIKSVLQYEPDPEYVVLVVYGCDNGQSSCTRGKLFLTMTSLAPPPG